MTKILTAQQKLAARHIPAARGVVKRLKISQRDIAFVAECSQAHVSDVLNGWHTDPAVEVAVDALVGDAVDHAELWS
jgi:hypothetical protein